MLVTKKTLIDKNEEDCTTHGHFRQATDFIVIIVTLSCNSFGLLIKVLQV